jgi:hypothetical protein
MFYTVNQFGESGNVKLKVEKIRSEFKGKIVKIYATKKTIPTHLEVALTDGKIINISPNQYLVNSADVGDFLIKPKNENRVYLIKSNKKKLTFFYTKISYETRNNKNFPVEWKNRWLESSQWDEKTDKDEK